MRFKAFVDVNGQVQNSGPTVLAEIVMVPASIAAQVDSFIGQVLSEVKSALWREVALKKTEVRALDVTVEIREGDKCFSNGTISVKGENHRMSELDDCFFDVTDRLYNSLSREIYHYILNSEPFRNL